MNVADVARSGRSRVMITLAAIVLAVGVAAAVWTRPTVSSAPTATSGSASQLVVHLTLMPTLGVLLPSATISFDGRMTRMNFNVHEVRYELPANFAIPAFLPGAPGPVPPGTGLVITGSPGRVRASTYPMPSEDQPSPPVTAIQLHNGVGILPTGGTAGYILDVVGYWPQGSAGFEASVNGGL